MRRLAGKLPDLEEFEWYPGGPYQISCGAESKHGQGKYVMGWLFDRKFSIVL